jgi:hypothetical protein
MDGLHTLVLQGKVLYLVRLTHLMPRSFTMNSSALGRL